MAGGSDKGRAFPHKGPADIWKAKCREALAPETEPSTQVSVPRYSSQGPAAQTQKTAWRELASNPGSAT